VKFLLIFFVSLLLPLSAVKAQSWDPKTIQSQPNTFKYTALRPQGMKGVSQEYPEILKGGSYEYDSLWISWTLAPMAWSYRVYRGDDYSADFVLVADVTDHIYLERGIGCGSEWYSFYVVPVYAGGEEGYPSNIVWVRTHECVMPPEYLITLGTDPADGWIKVTFNWGAVNGADGYQLNLLDPNVSWEPVGFDVGNQTWFEYWLPCNRQTIVMIRTASLGYFSDWKSWIVDPSCGPTPNPIPVQEVTKKKVFVPLVGTP